MGDKTSISWCDSSWNPWRGCDKVSPGCANCYMFRDQQRYGRDPSVVVRAAPATFNAPLKWQDGRFVFTCSWSDFFHPSADAWRPEAWEIIRQTPQHTYQILTKRPENIRDRLPQGWEDQEHPISWNLAPEWRHVWLGVSVENQRWVERFGKLPAHGLGFISAEPLLGPLDLSDWIRDIGWVIVGGESGPDYREMHLDWLASVVQQCRDAEVPVWVKQDSGKLPGQRGRIPDELWIQERPAVGHAGER